MSIEERRSKPVIKSYVYHDDKCYFVSTINRIYDTMHGSMWGDETIVWEIDLETNHRKKDILYHGGDYISHYDVCKYISENGTMPEDE